MRRGPQDSRPTKPLPPAFSQRLVASRLKHHHCSRLASLQLAPHLPWIYFSHPLSTNTRNASMDEDCLEPLPPRHTALLLSPQDERDRLDSPAVHSAPSESHSSCHLTHVSLVTSHEPESFPCPASMLPPSQESGSPTRAHLLASCSPMPPFPSC